LIIDDFFEIEFDCLVVALKEPLELGIRGSHVVPFAGYQIEKRMHFRANGKGEVYEREANMMTFVSWFPR